MTDHVINNCKIKMTNLKIKLISHQLTLGWDGWAVVLASFSQDGLLGNVRLGTFAWELPSKVLRLDISLGIFNVGSFAWGSFVSKKRIGSFARTSRFGLCVRGVSLGICCSDPFVSDPFSRTLRASTVAKRSCETNEHKICHHLIMQKSDKLTRPTGV